MQVELSKRQLNTLLYWAHAGAATSHNAMAYRKEFPARPAYDKIRSIEKHLIKYGFWRR
jgi:hypothetical protein